MEPFGQNFLEEQAWGRFPKSRRRRRMALRSLLTCTLLYVGLLAMVATIFTVISLKTQGRVDDALPGILTYFSFFVGAWFCAVAPFQVENRFSNARQLLANQHDYRLAGMTGRGMLRGIAAPQLAGAKLFAVVHLVIVSGFLAYVSENVNNVPRRLAMIVIGIPVVILIASVFDVFVGTRFNLAQWRYPGRGFRSLKTACFVFSSPFTVMVCCPFLFRFSSQSTIETLLFVEIALLVIRWRWAAAEWRRAERWLDGDEGAQPAAIGPIKAQVKAG